jgi:hypothetical protein
VIQLAPRSIDLELSLRQICPQRNIPTDAVLEELSLTKENCVYVFAKPLIPFFSEKNYGAFLETLS